MSSMKEYIQYGPSFQTAQIEEKALLLPPSCASLEGRALLFVSDIHLSRRFPRSALDRLLLQIDDLHPDLILLGGDYAESLEWQKEFFQTAGCLRAPLGMYAVAGNNDCECFLDDLESMRDMAAQAGITLLINQTARIRIGSSLISIAGTDEFQRSGAAVAPLFTEEDADAYRILLAHYPQSVSQYCAAYFEHAPHIALAGHTHGGQFSFLGLTPYSIGYEYRKKGVMLPAVRGWKAIGDTSLLVSAGIGTSKLPLRIGVKPEIHLFRLRALTDCKTQK